MLERKAEVARKLELLKRRTVEARRKHACLMLSKADDESRLWNDRIRIEENTAQAKLQELARLEKKRRVRVARDEDGNPVDIRL